MNRQFIGFLLSVCVLLLAACAKDLTSEEHVAKAREYLDGGDYGSAQIELKNATRKDPNNADARYELAGVAMILGDAAGAEDSARRAVELGIPPKDVALLIVRSAYMQGQYDRVLAETESFPPELDDSVSADLLGYRALALLQQQKYRSADAVLEIALDLADDSVMALLAKASYEAQVGRLETAMGLASRAVEIDPASAEGWALIGELLSARGNLTEARDAYDKAVASRPYVSMLFARRAYINAQMGEFAAADTDINKLLENGFKRVPYVNFVQGYTEFRRGNFAEASAALQLALSGNPEDPLSKFYFVASLMELGKSDQEKLDQAQMAANQLYNDIPNSVEVARMLASIDIQKEDFSAAQERLVAMLEQNENDTVALGMLGSIALVKGDGEQAAEYFERLVALTPDDDDVKRLLIRARTMRGDFVAELSSKAERQVAPEEFDQVLTSAAVALQQGQLSEALVIAQNLQEQFPDNVEPVKMIAAIYTAAGDWQTGKSLLEDVLSLEPLEPSATKALAKIYIRSGEGARAEQLISAYLRENPKDQDAVGLLSQIIVATTDYPQSEVLLAELGQKYPENLQVSARLTRLYFDQGNYQRVLLRTENLSEEDITAQPSLMELKGKSFINLGEYDRAAGTWERWVEISPDYVLSNYYHAGSLARSGQLDLAKEFLEKSHKLNPDYIPARIALIRINALSGDLEAAFIEMKKLQSELTRERADVWYTQGWLNARAGNYDDAANALNKSLALDPMPQAAILLYTALNTAGRTEDALLSLEKWSKSFPDNLDMLTLLGHAYLSRDDKAEAVAVYSRILELEPVSTRALNNLAWLLQDTDLAQATKYARQASVSAPEDPIVLHTLGILLGKSGENQEAESLLRRSVQLQPENQRWRMDLGRQLLNQGDPADARKVLGELVELTENEALAAEATALINAMPQEE